MSDRLWIPLAAAFAVMAVTAYLAIVPASELCDRHGSVDALFLPCR